MNLELTERLQPWYKLGCITPHAFVDNLPYQFYRLAPEGMMFVMANLDLADYTRDAVEHELPLLWKHAAALGKRKVDRLVISGVPVAAALGRERVQELLREARARTGVEADNDLEALIASMQHMNVQKVAMATRWHESLNDAVAGYLALGGIEVIGRKASGKSLAENEVLTDADGMRLAVDLGREALSASPEAQGVLLPGGLWISIHAIPVLEAEFGKPVFVNVASTLWAALRSAGYKQPVQGWGKLLASL